jgi:structural maintenance of chromosome 1
MKRLFSGVRGRLTDLVSPIDRRYNTAVAVALGKHMDAVVVNAEATAFECIAWLREHNHRPMMFLPLDSLKAKEADDTLLAQLQHSSRGAGAGAGAGAGRAAGTGGGRSGAAAGGATPYRLARDCLRFDPSLDRAVAYACGTCVIADSLADAKTLRYERDVRVKVVALDGTVIAKNGNMTGGVAAGDKEMARGAGGWDEREFRAAQGRRDELLREEELLRRRLTKGRGAGIGDGGGAGAGAGSGGTSASWNTQIEDAEGSLATLLNRQAIISKDLEATAAKLADCTTELADIGKKLTEQTPEYEAAQAAIASADAKAAAVQEEVSSVAEDVFAPFTKGA